MTEASTSAMASVALDQVQKKFGFVPNLLREMSVSPAVLQAYLSGQEALAKGALSPKEQQAVQLTVATTNGCGYCQAAHGWIGRQVGLPPDDVQRIRSGDLPQDKDVAGVVQATRLVLERKGWLQEDGIRAVEQWGVTRAKLYDIVAYIGLKTISNYINHIAGTPIDEQFAA